MDQSVALRISVTVTPCNAVVYQAAPLTEYALKVSTAMTASWRHVGSHLAIVLLETGSCFVIHDKNKVEL